MKVLVAAMLMAAALVGAPSMPPCELEDSAGPCFWDASARGNGTGRSFVVTADQVVIYQ